MKNSKICRYIFSIKAKVIIINIEHSREQILICFSLLFKHLKLKSTFLSMNNLLFQFC